MKDSEIRPTYERRAEDPAEIDKIGGLQDAVDRVPEDITERRTVVEVEAD